MHNAVVNSRGLLRWDPDILAPLGPHAVGSRPTCHPQALHLLVRPAPRIVVEGDFPHAFCLFQHFLVYADLVRVHLLQDVELLEGATSTEHHIHHSWLVGALHINNKVVGLADLTALQFQPLDWAVKG